MEEAPLDAVGDVNLNGKILNGLSMDVLAQRAGVGKATIYRRWDSKEALILDALRTRQFGYIIAVSATGFFLVSVMGIPSLTSGYVDIPVAFMSFVPVYLLLVSESVRSPAMVTRNLALGAIFCAGAGMTKQAGLFRPISLFPYPGQALLQAAEKARHVLVSEMSCGQMVEDVRYHVAGRRPVSFYGRVGGMIMTPEELVSEAQKLAGRRG